MKGPNFQNPERIIFPAGSMLADSVATQLGRAITFPDPQGELQALSNGLDRLSGLGLHAATLATELNSRLDEATELTRKDTAERHTFMLRQHQKARVLDSDSEKGVGWFDIGQANPEPFFQIIQEAATATPVPELQSTDEKTAYEVLKATTGQMRTRLMGDATELATLIPVHTPDAPAYTDMKLRHVLRMLLTFKGLPIPPYQPLPDHLQKHAEMQRISRRARKLCQAIESLIEHPYAELADLVFTQFGEAIPATVEHAIELGIAARNTPLVDQLHSVKSVYHHAPPPEPLQTPFPRPRSISGALLLELLAQMPMIRRSNLQHP